MNEPQQQRSRVEDGQSRWLLRVVCALVMLTSCLAGGTTHAARPDEYTLKVAYLYKFTRYITWPSDAWPAGEQEFVIGIIGENPFGRTLDLLARKKLAKKRNIVVKYFGTLAECTHCHMLFIADSVTPDTRAAIVRQTRNQPVLLIGESVGYCETGATINFVILSDETIRIEINIDAMNRRQMQVNALLLQLATVVRDQRSE